MTQDLLIEIGTEELPPKSLLDLSKAFVDQIQDGLRDAGLTFQNIIPYATPRRLALLVKQLQTEQAGKTVERRGPALQAAFDTHGHPTAAALGFAKSCGVEINRVEKLQTDKGGWLVFRSVQAGKPAVEILPALVQQALDKLPTGKRMRWADREAHFVRPVHWVVLLLGGQVIEAEILSVRSGQHTYGHRFMAPEPIFIPQADEYELLLESKGKVIAAFDRRRSTIRAQIEQTAHASGGKAVIAVALLEEVTSMIEWPCAVLGSFEPRYLTVPKEALISTMSANQRYFHLVDAQQNLVPYFITISNIEHADMSRVRGGNERVIRPRFADAEFFWDQDRKRPLVSRLPDLKSVVFQAKLGSLYDKSQRIATLAVNIGSAVGADTPHTRRAAELCKCDLLSTMVGEFPELQGTMGRYYARHDHEPGEIAQAIEEHYQPRFAGDALPCSSTGLALAIADRLDSLVGIFAIGQAPSGDKDPFGLRRAALGVVRMLIEAQLPVDLYRLITQAAEAYPAALHAEHVCDAVFDFVLERTRVYYQQQDIRPDVFEAVKALRPTLLMDFDARLRAVNAFLDDPAAEALASANKRISNILKKNQAPLAAQLNAGLLHEDAEQELAAAVQQAQLALTPLITRRDYDAVLRILARLRPMVDSFFDDVMVMVEDSALRHNRLTLLNQLRNLFLNVADISQLQTSKLA
ncbi:MAG: glycine--tRNA ligase subunit beta [Gammaproteobacteria bacterium]|nr:glycine--tRNA ligase subunit beta [Gammaproteobacteria bacterium]